MIRWRWPVAGHIVSLAILAAGPAAAVPVCQSMPGDTAIVCVWGEGEPATCQTTNYVLEICFDSGGAGGGQNPPNDPSQWQDFTLINPGDSNLNHIIDDWGAVVDTNDTCANNFDTNDRLGKSYGGPNTQRTGHQGTDLQCNRGDAVAAMMSGTVVSAGPGSWSASCGTSVQIAHIDGSQSWYCHLLDTGLFPGQFVWAGAVIGRCNNTGNSSGDHLHLAFRDTGGKRREYFNYTDSRPKSKHLNPNGC